MWSRDTLQEKTPLMGGGFLNFIAMKTNTLRSELSRWVSIYDNDSFNSFNLFLTEVSI